MVPGGDGAPAATADEVRSRVDAAWAAFRQAIADLGAALEEPTASGWTAKEMLAHVAFWDEAVVPVVHTMVRGEALPAGWAFGSGELDLGGGPWPPTDVHNAREAAWARPRPPAEVVARADRAHAELVSLLGTVTDDEVASRPGSFAGLGSHYDEHRAELETLW